MGQEPPSAKGCKEKASSSGMTYPISILKAPRTIPRSTKINARNDNKRGGKNKKRKNKKNVVRGKEITVRESASTWQVIYGKMKVGGVVTFVETSSNSSAYLVSGTGNSQVAWTARTGGTAGNNITIRIILSGTNPTLTVGVVGNDITVTLKSTSGTSETTADQLITKVRNTAAANALVAVNKGSGDGTGLMAAFSQTPLTGGGGTWLHQVVTLAGHEINAIEKLYLDGREVTFGATPDARWGTGIWADRVFMALNAGSDTQEAQPDLSAQLPSKWTSSHRQAGCAHAYIILGWDPNVFAEGLPEISFLVQGKKVYDPRSALTTYSTNAALIVADFLVNTRWGMGVPYADIDEPQLIAAANLCDSRFQINGVFDSAQSKDETLAQLLAAMGGDLVYASGKYYIIPATYRTPTKTLTIDDARGPIGVKTHVSRSDSFNIARGTFISTDTDYNETDIPPVKNTTYIAQDGRETYEDFALNFVTSAEQAQRLLKIELERNRQGITVTFPAKLTAMELRAGDNVYLTLEEFGWSAKIFEVQEVDWALGAQDMGLDLVLRETASALFDPTADFSTDVAPNTNLPSATDVAAPSGLVLTSGTAELYVRVDGTVQTRLKATWNSSTTQFVVFGGFFEIQFKRSADTLWSQSFNVPGSTTFHYLLDVQDNVQYDVRIRAVNTLNYASAWTTVSNHLVVGKTAPPSDVTGFTGTVTDDGIFLAWNQISDVDRDQFEIRQDGSDWNTATFVTRFKGSGTSYLANYRTAGTVTYRIKAIDTSGNYSTNATSLAFTLTGPNPVQNFITKTVGNSVMLDWEEPAPSTFSVIEYDVYKGPTFGTSVRIGTVFGTFHTYVESVGGDFTYYVVAVDKGGNRSTEVSAGAVVSAPDNFYILDEQDPIPEWVSYRHAIVGGSPGAPAELDNKILLPVITETGGAGPAWILPREPSASAETFSDWWDSNGWTTLQDAIDDGFDPWPNPSTTTAGYLVMEIDFGVLFANSFVDWDWVETQIGDATLITPTISTSPDNSVWTDYAGVQQIFGTNFRYLRLRLDFEGSTNDALSLLSDMLVTVSLERDEETGIAACLAADAGGTTVNFTKAWLDVEDIQLTAEGTTPAYPLLNFSDVPNPISFKIPVFNDSGTRVNCSVRYRVRGALNA